MDLQQYLDNSIKNEDDKKNVFLYNGEQIKALAFRDGCKCDCLTDIKNKIKKIGFKYDYNFGAYVLKNWKDSGYRNEKNEFISKLIRFKLNKTKTSKNESEKIRINNI